MDDHKVIAVTGATGAQGGGVARAILADPDSGFTVRALTRTPVQPPPENSPHTGPRSSKQTSTTSRACTRHSTAPTARS
jgi:nucleoside-diphosphate-sugar epimerase